MKQYKYISFFLLVALLLSVAPDAVVSVEGRKGDVDIIAADIQDMPAVPTAVSQLTNDSGYATGLDITYVDVDKSSLATFTVTGDGNQPNEISTLTSTREDTGWSMSNNEATFTGSPDKVYITVNLVYDDGLSNTKQRIAPEAQLLRNGIVISESATGYQRHSNNHSNTSNNFPICDGSPGVNPVYSIRAQQGSSQNDVLMITSGWLTVDAIEKISVPVSITITN